MRMCMGKAKIHCIIPDQGDVLYIDYSHISCRNAASVGGGNCHHYVVKANHGTISCISRHEKGYCNKPICMSQIQCVRCFFLCIVVILL